MDAIQPNSCGEKSSEKPLSYRLQNLEKCRAAERRYYLKRKQNPEKIKSDYQKWYSKNKLKKKSYDDAYRAKHRERYRMNSHLWWQNHKQHVLDKNKRWRANNKEKLKGCHKKYYLKNLRKIIQKKCIYVSNRRKTDVQFNLAMQCRTRIWFALKDQNAIKSKKSFDLIGCSPEFFKQFIEAQFTNGMSWDNYGKEWHIDHIIPVSKFDLKQPEEQKRAFHYSNCRPLPKVENIVKADKMPAPHQALLI